VKPWIIAILCIPPVAADHWVEVDSRPFEVMSSAGDKAAREQLDQLEQFRYALGAAIGKSDLQLLWPLRVLVSKNARATTPALARSSYLAAAPENTLFSRDQLRELARLLIGQNTSRLPASIEDGLIAVFSTLQVNGTRITLGAPPPQAERTRDWARMHMFTVRPEYSGRTRVLISNLEQGSEFEPAYRNAFEKSSAAIEKDLDAYIAAGKFETSSASGRPVNPTRDFHVHPLEANDASLALADFALATHPDQADASYTALHGAGAAEGLALLALAHNRKDEAHRLLASAIESKSRNARAWYELALLGPDPAKARTLLQRAAELNPRWAAPWAKLAQLEIDTTRRVDFFKKAAALEPRNATYWQSLAESYIAAKQFIDAQKAWGGAERAAANPAERDRIRQVRLDLQAQRADYEAAERKRRADEEARDLERVKNAGMSDIHAAEAASHKKLNPDGAAPVTATEWWGGDETSGKLEGMLERFDCLGRQARLVIRTPDTKTVQLLVANPSKIVLTGGGETSLACGPQRPPRKLTAQYIPKLNKKLNTVGEAVTLEFR
jgi:hypothetical protein